MANFIAISLIVSAALCGAAPARLENLIPSKSKFFARQEVVEDIPAQTPYPPAGIRPEIPFNLPTDEKVESSTADVSSLEKIVVPVDYYLPPVFEPAKFSVPAKVYGPPAKTYGPPEVSPKEEGEEGDEAKSEEPQPEEAQPEEAKREKQQPEEIQPVDDETEQDVLEVEPVETTDTSNNELERIVLPKKTKKSAKLRSAKLQIPQSVTAQRFFLIEGKLYTSKE